MMGSLFRALGLGASEESLDLTSKVLAHNPKNIFNAVTEATLPRKGFLSAIKSRGALAGAYIGAGYLGGAVTDFAAERARAYHGDAEFERRYKGYHGLVSDTYRTAGLVLGGAAMLKMDPIGGLKAKVSRIPEYRRLRNIASGKTTKQYINAGTLQAYEAPFPAASRKTAAESARRISPYKGLGLKLGLLGTAAGTAGAITLYNPGAVIGIGALGGAAIATPLIAKYKKGFGITAGAIGVGIGAGSLREPYPTAEAGNLNIEHANQSTVSRLNYNTAGLTQALYRNRRAR